MRGAARYTQHVAGTDFDGDDLAVKVQEEDSAAGRG